MGLDIRWPIGLMFALIGALLVITGFTNDADARSLGININLIWGLVLIVFAAFMLLMAWRGAKCAKNKPPGADAPK